MDPTIVNTLITAVTSFVTCVIGLQAGKRDAASPSVRTIRERQLMELYVPMVQILEPHSGSGVRHKIEALQTVVGKNPELVHPIIYAEVARISSISQPVDNDLTETKKVVYSFFNWTRRSLGYPYDADKIRKTLTPVYERNSTIKGVVVFIAIFTWFVSAVMTLQLLFGGGPDISVTAKKIILSILYLGIMWFVCLLLPHISKR